METRKIPFDVEKAKRGAKVVTRDGRNVEIIHFNKKGGEYPIVALVDNVVYKGISQEIYCYTTKGRYTLVNPTKYDLLIEEEVEEQGEQKSSDEFKIMPDKWYVCTLGWESCGWDGDWKFVEGSTYLGSEILQCYPMDEKEIQDHVRLWTICDAKPGDILATKNGYNILIFKNINSSSGSGFSSYYNYNNFSDYSDFKEGSWNRYRFTPATKEQRELLFQKIKEAGYKWDTNKKELREIREVKPRRMTNQELSWWLQEHPEEHRECKCKYSDSYRVFNTLSYMEDVENKPVPDFYFIRKNGGEWQEPLIEI